MSPPERSSSFRSSFQFKLFSIFSLLTFLIACTLCFLYIVSVIQEKRLAANEQLKLRTEQLGESARLPLYAGNRDLLRQLAERAAQAPEISAVVINDPDGKLLAFVGSPDDSKSIGLISQTVEVFSNPLTYSVDSSFTGGHEASRTKIGTVRIVRGTADLSAAVRNVIIFSVSISFLFWLTVSLFCHIVLRQVTGSFNALMKGIEAVHNGDFTSRINIVTNDEPGRAAVAVNNLATELQQRSEENSRLQEERLNLERQMLQTQKLESLGVMAGGIAHDFNNLLQSILGNIELASMGLAPSSKSQKYLANALNSGRHAAHLTSLMLTYVGVGFITKEEVNLNHLVMDNTEMLNTVVLAGASMKLSLSPELPTILACEAQIQQVVMNLITNAAESIEEQPGIIKLTTGIQDCDQTFLASSLLEEKPLPGRFAYLEVSDNGCGMSKETIKLIFDPFFTTKFTGRGLGMSAVMGIMRTHRGALFVESKPGKGTTFRALFPVSESSLPATDQEQVTSASVIDTMPLTTHSGLALVVDDEKSVLKVCTKMVKLCGFRVITAHDGVDAVAKFREHSDDIAVVLMDLTMPNMDGIAAMNEIYNIRPDTKVILASGFNEEELGGRTTTGQAPSGLIRKPYSMNLLEAELSRVMQQAE
ncbi:MAG: ATP-binding protein [Desulfuromonadaceae bacterium]|nr:ATP-binding protein [Desulfuromonadaceae bacterium]